MVIAWEDPPVNYDDVVTELQSRPGTWARVLDPTGRERARTVSKALRRHGCEARMRKISEAGVAVWARWPLTQQNPRRDSEGSVGGEGVPLDGPGEGRPRSVRVLDRPSAGEPDVVAIGVGR